MKKIILSLLIASSSTVAFAQAESLPSIKQESKSQIMFTCGGNTGRSVMASWYTNAKYGNTIDGFSRGSGVDPLDDVYPEPNAAQLILDNHYATLDELAMQRATPATIQDAYNANIVLTMTSSHRDRLIKLIDRECLASNIKLRDLSTSSQAQWNKMCDNKELLKAKIHTLIGCATGVDANIDDAFGKDMPFYQQTLTTIQNNIDQLVTNHNKTGYWCINNRK